MARRFLGKTIGVLGYMIQYGCIAHCTFEYVVTFAWLDGPSMKPTLNAKEIVLADNVTRVKRNFQKGDIVISRSPTNPSMQICKRLVAMEGDWVYDCDENLTKKVPRGHVWLEGDNKSNSTDSREFGPVPYALLRSRVFFKIWPVDRIGVVQLPAEET